MQGYIPCLFNNKALPTLTNIVAESPENGDNLSRRQSPKTATVDKFGDCRRILRL